MDVKNAASREGGVGKTQLIRALLGEPFRQGGSKTPGIDIRPVELEHPSEEAVTMRLNAWDFGGQEIYHATHQFFLTERSLFLLVWNARHGWEQGKLYYWLDTIQAKAPNSPVLIVAAHSDEHPPNLPILEIQRRYPQVLAHNEVSNLNGAGIRELREKLREVAAGLPLMGEIMPTSWLKAANAVRALSARSISPKRLFETMVQEGVTGDSARILAQWLHDQGELLYFQGDQELNDTVILEPEWVTSYIYRVLDNEAVIARSGVFRRDDMLEGVGGTRRLSTAPLHPPDGAIRPVL